MAVTITYREVPGGWAGFLDGPEYLAFMTRLGNRVVNGGKTRCPVDTGYLQSSIRLELLGGGQFQVSANTHYAVYVHDGTSRVTARPFLSDALAAEVGRL